MLTRLIFAHLIVWVTAKDQYYHNVSVKDERFDNNLGSVLRRLVIRLLNV